MTTRYVASWISSWGNQPDEEEFDHELIEYSNKPFATFEEAKTYAQANSICEWAYVYEEEERIDDGVPFWSEAARHNVEKCSEASV